MTPLELIGLPQSNFVWATRIAAGFKGVPHTLQPTPPHSGDAAAIHPLGRIPVMRHGAVTLYESRAICTYIDRAFEGPALVPLEPAAAALVEQWTSLLITTIEPVLIRQLLFAHLFPGTPDGAPDQARIEAALPVAQRHLGLLEAAVETGRLAGQEASVADAYLVPILFYLQHLPETKPIIEGSAALRGYLERMLALGPVALTVPPPLPRS